VAATVAAAGLFLAVWAVAPAPTAFLLLFGALAPEIAPLLVVWGALVAALGRVRAFGRRTRAGLAASGAATALLAAVPPLRLPAAVRAFDAEVARALGAGYLDAVAPSARSAMRPAPFRARDLVSGLVAGGDAPGVRVRRDVPYASAPGGASLTMDVYAPPGADA
jgi:hypothetical protein